MLLPQLLYAVATLLACFSDPAAAFAPRGSPSDEIPTPQTDANEVSALRGTPTTILAKKVGEADEHNLEEAATTLQETLKALDSEIAAAQVSKKWGDVAVAIRKAKNRTAQMMEQFSDPECWMYAGHRKGIKTHADDPANGGEDSHFGWTPMKCWTSLRHPYLYLFAGHTILALLTTVLAFKAPKMLMVCMFMSGLLWPLSAVMTAAKGDEVGNIWGQKAWDFDWIMCGVKWLIVDLAAGVPILLVKASDVSKNFTEQTGNFIYIILGANILWTLIYKVDGWVRFFNFVVGINLVLSLFIYVLALKKVGKSLLEKINGVPYGRATPLYWLVSYTIWNATFVGDLSIGITLQDGLFWAMMFLMQRVDEKPLTVDLYFAFARPLQLGTYIAFGCWSGIIPWFRDAEKYHPVMNLGINDDFYFLFITMANLLVSVLAVAESVRAYIYGPRAGVVQRSLSMVHIPRQSEAQRKVTFAASFDNDVSEAGSYDMTSAQ